MRLPLSWLLEYAAIDLSPDNWARRPGDVEAADCRRPGGRVG